MNLEAALGDGWLRWAVGGAVSFIGGGVAAWIAKRPLEKAGVLAAVNARLETFMQTQQDSLEAERAAHERCEERIEALEQHRVRDRDEIDQLRGQLNQEKQMAASIIRLAEKAP